jgi:hypothetical protein
LSLQAGVPSANTVPIASVRTSVRDFIGHLL